MNEVDGSRETETREPETQAPRLTPSIESVKVDCTAEGWVFSANGETVGPLALKELDDPEAVFKIANKLGVEANAVTVAHLAAYSRDISLEELAEILESTIKRDNPSKLATFLAMLLAQADEDSFNIAFQAESSTGKSYIPVQLIEFFPETDRKIYAGASPTSFFHEAGEWNKDLKSFVVDLKGKIVIFLDNPHWLLMEKLRPLLSHDRRELIYKITDRSRSGPLRTKTVILRGYCTVAFCTTKPTLEDQERTRMILLSPETGQEKIKAALELQTKRGCDRSIFKQWIENHPQRVWLKERVRMIRDKRITDIVIPNGQEDVFDRYLTEHKYLHPRDMRDYPRLLALIKGVTLLNCFNREINENGSVLATKTDIDAGFKLYQKLAESNELGLSPETYEIYRKIIKPLAEELKRGATRREIITEYFTVYHRPVSHRRLRKAILPTLEAAGLVTEEPDPTDKRRTLIAPVNLSATTQETLEGAQ